MLGKITELFYMLLNKIPKPLKFFLVLIICIGIGIYFFSDKTETTNNAYVRSDITNISSEINGNIKTIHFQDNQFVEKDELLITIDDEIYRNRYILAKTNYDIANQDNQKLSTKLEQVKYDIIKAENDLHAASAQFNKSLHDYQREKSLLSSKVASKQKFEGVETDYIKQNNNVSSLKAALARIQKDFQLAEIEYQQSLLKFTIKEAELRIAEKHLRNTQIKAPFAGYVANKVTEEGNYVVIGTPLISLVPKDVYIVANFKETQISRMKSGQKVDISIDAFPGEKLEGEVVSISAGSGAIFSLLPPENASGNFTKIVQRYPVKIKFINKGKLEDLIKPGLSVEVTVGIN
jgi:membrane fusion protein (multidrug efflux system)